MILPPRYSECSSPYLAAKIYSRFKSESSANFRPTQRSKHSTTTSSPKTSSTSSTSKNCVDEAPNILGFEGPMRGVDIGLTDTENDSTNVFYRCTGGKVVDVYTNRRVVRLPCKDVANFTSPKKWPKCKKPKNCVGPARKPGNVSNNYVRFIYIEIVVFT